MTFLLFYTDPGSGMMLLQLLFAFAAGVMFYFRKFFYKLFGKDKSVDNPPDNKTDSKPASDTDKEV